MSTKRTMPHRAFHGPAVLIVALLFVTAACSSEAPEAGQTPSAATAVDASAGVTAGTTGQSASTATAAAQPRSNDAFPDFQLPLLRRGTQPKGELASLSQFEGKAVVLNFWYPSCPPCRLEIPHFEEAWRDHEGDGVQFLGVQQLGLDTVEDGERFIEDFDVTYPVVYDSDGSTIRQNKIISFPTTVFLNKRHELVRTWAGVLNREKLDELIEEVLQ